MSSRKLLKNCLQVVQSTSAMFDSFPKGCWDVAQVSTGTLEYGFRSGILAVRVKGGMSLRNSMWHGLRNDIIMRNVIYAESLKEIN